MGLAPAKWCALRAGLDTLARMPFTPPDPGKVLDKLREARADLQELARLNPARAAEYDRAADEVHALVDRLAALTDAASS